MRLVKLVEQALPRIALSENDRRELIAARHMAKIRGKVLAHRLGVSLGTLNKYESGERRPPASLLFAWRALLATALRQAA